MSGFWGFGLGLVFAAVGPTLRYALNFNGTNSYGVVPNRTTSIEPTGDFTVAARFRFDGSYNASRYPVVITAWDGADEDYWWLAPHNSDQNRIVAEFVVGGTPYALYGPVIDNNWHDAAMWRSGTQLRLRVDGVTYGPITVASGAVTNPNTRLWLGHYDETDPAGAFEGLVSRSAYWDGLLDGASLEAQEAALDLHFAGDTLNGDPDHAWPINEGDGATTSDVVGNINFDLTNTTWETIEEDLIVFHGDSYMDDLVLRKSFSTQTRNLLDTSTYPATMVTYGAVSGKNSEQQLNEYATLIAPLYNPKKRRNILVSIPASGDGSVGPGGGASIAEMLQNIQDWVNAAKSTGWQVVLGTLPIWDFSAGDWVLETAQDRADFNAGILALNNVDAFWDIEPDEFMGSAGSVANTTYFQDGDSVPHPTVVGYGRMAALAASAIETLR